MKYFLTLIALFSGICHPVRTSAQVIDLDGNTTRAVVIGISDYQDAAIPDLRFADRDAEAFAQWLRSPAGGSLQADKIKVLTNKDATTGKMIAALDWLIVASKPGDDAIIYFSGHGDVERVTKFQRGFLLTYDSPSAVYAAGAFSLQYLQDIVTTLSEAGVQAVVITDACRAGKLAGSEFGGSKATSAALAQQFANEVKILSCQPDEFSLEGEQWGGGRGCFSYHLTDALYGMADANADGTVNLLELGRYLEDKVPAETAPHSQIPFTVGSKSTHIASVNVPALAEWRQRKKDDPSLFLSTDTKGLEGMVLAKVDTSLQALYAGFTAALERGDLMETKDSALQSANELYEVLIKEPALADLHGTMTRNFAAALMDEGQQVINQLLKTDPKTFEMVVNGKIDFLKISRRLEKAASLLGEHHYAYNTLKAKEHFFKAKTFRSDTFMGISTDSLSKMQKQALLSGLKYDAEAPYLLYSLMEFPVVNLLSIDSMRLIADSLTEHAPNWALGLYKMGLAFSVNGEDYKLSSFYLNKAIAVDSTFLLPYIMLGDNLLKTGNYPEAQIMWSLYASKMQEKIASDQFLLTAYEYNGYGNTLWKLRRFRDAEKALLEAERIDREHVPGSVYGNLGVVYPSMGKFREAIKTFENLYEKTSAVWAFSSIGNIWYHYLHDRQKAEEMFEKVPLYLKIHFLIQTAPSDIVVKSLDSLLKESPEDIHFQFWQGEICSRIGNSDKAKQAFQKVANLAKLEYLPHDDRNVSDYLLQMIALYRLNRKNDLKKAIRQATGALEDDAWFHYHMACFYAMTNKPEKAFAQLEKAAELGWEPTQAIWINGTVKDPLLAPLRPLPAFQAWEQRWLPPYKDYSKE